MTTNGTIGMKTQECSFFAKPGNWDKITFYMHKAYKGVNNPYISIENASLEESDARNIVI